MIELNPPLHSVSEITQTRLGIIRDTQEHYRPDESVLRAIGQKSLIPIVGPTAIGKSFITDKLADMDPHFTKVLSFSTRDPRPDDTPETMSCLPWDERHIKRICNVIERGDAVQYVFHRDTGDIYGTTLESYPGEYNLLPALSDSIARLETLPFRSLHITGLIATPELWTKWFSAREFPSEEDRRNWLSESATSLIWLLEHQAVPIVTNLNGNAQQTARIIRRLTLEPPEILPRDERTTEALLDHIQRTA
jgi:hypothetical protein